MRLLTNLETHKEKLLRIMLIGQPELAELLARPDLRQLAQRITARYHLTPLGEQETVEYIAHRLRIAGTRQEIFLPPAVREIHRHARGIPRLINIICDRALLGAYAAGARQVTAEMARRAANESMDQHTTPAKREPLRQQLLRSAEFLFATLALILVSTLLYQVISDRFAKPANRPVAPAAAAAVHAVEPTVAAAAVHRAPYQILQAPQPLPVVMSRLVNLWEPGFRVPPSSENICQALKDKHLECLKSHGDWIELKLLNRPAILTLRGEDGAPRYVLLKSLTDVQVTLDTASGAQSYPIEQVTPLWSGEFLILWRRELDIPGITPRSSGAPVVWLRKRLAAFAGKTLTDPVSAFYDAGLRKQVIDFQAAHGIDHSQNSGIVGVRTMISLGDNQPGTPNLAGGTP
ncbi:MAG: peptidoglycan-binding protein [Stenotrophobium sp.]